MSSAQLRRLRANKVPSVIKNVTPPQTKPAEMNPILQKISLNKEPSLISKLQTSAATSPALGQELQSTSVSEIANTVQPSSANNSVDVKHEQPSQIQLREQPSRELSQRCSRIENPELIGEVFAEQSDDDLPLIEFESEKQRPNDGESKKLIHVAKDLGPEDERVLKKVIKSMSEKRMKDGEVKSIENFRIIIDTYYPRVTMTYKLNGIDRIGNILNLYKGEKDPHARHIVTRTFSDHFKWLSKSACEVLMDIVKYRYSFTHQRYVGDYDYRQHSLARTLVAVYSIIPNGTIQFIFVDIHYVEISFNNYFIEENKKHFPNAYSFFEKTFKPRLSKGGDAPSQSPHAVNDEQVSSDEESEPILKNPIPPAEVQDNISRMLKEDLGFYEDRINQKQQEYQVKSEGYIEDRTSDRRQRKHDSYTDQEQLEVMSERIVEMQLAFDNYKHKIAELRKNYEHLLRSKIHDIDKKVKIGLIYKQLRMLRVQLESELPIVLKKKELFECLDQHSLIILEGETGSGKSTQLPQLLCEYYGIFKDDRTRPILLTQPRKIATRTLAERIAKEMDEEVHGFVGYVASSGNKPHRNSKIIVKLDRLLLDELESDPLLTKYSCLIIDEAHERTISIDIITGFVSKILQSRRDFKVIITSATLDADLFEKFFLSSRFAVSKFKLPGRLHRVTTIHKPYPQEELIENQIYRCLTEELLEDLSSLKNIFKGHVLCFCTGVEQINRLCYRTKELLNPNNFVVVALHGKLTTDEQKIAFEEPPGKSKIIFCTRIAQTAITINQVKVVIDPGQDRLSCFDESRRISSFQLGPISKSAAKQRAGRAGRTSEGYCFKLYDEEFERYAMKANKTPEIDSSPLDHFVLRLKTLKVPDLSKFSYLSQPNQDSLNSSVESMQIIGCLDDRKEITQIGRQIMRIPIEPFLSRAIIDGIIVEKLSPSKNVVEKIVKILSIVANSQSVFISSEDSKEFCEKARFNEFAQPEGDFFSLLNVYEAFQNEIVRGRERGNSFVRERFLNKKSMFEAKDLINEIMTIVGKINLRPEDFEDYAYEVQAKIANFPDTKDLVLSCLLASFCQNLCLFSNNAQIGYTMICNQQPIQIFSSSFLALQGINPKWIVCYDICKTSSTFCRIAQQVTFDMLRKSVSKKVFERYKLAECEQCNPFYRMFELSLPTVVLRDLQQRNLDNEFDQNLPWLVESKCIFDRNNNRLKIYIPESKLNAIKNLERDIDTMIKQLRNKSVYHSYINSVTAEIGNGCVVKKLNLHNNLYSLKLTNIGAEMQAFIREEYEQFCESIECNKKELVITFDSEDEANMFLRWKEMMSETEPQLQQCQVEVVKNYFERLNRVPKTSLKLTFWASLAVDHERLLLMYSSRDQAGNEIDLFSELIYETRKYLQHYFPYLKFNVSKKGDSITVYLNRGQCSISDDYELKQELNKFYSVENPPLRHVRVIAFRQYDDHYSTLSIPKWIELIQQKFNELGEEVLDKDIKIVGSCQDRECQKNRPKVPAYYRKEERPQRDCDHHMTEIRANIWLFNSKIAMNFSNAYNGKQGVLGTQKLHTMIQEQQCIIRVPGPVYSIFRVKYVEEKFKLERQYNRMLISSKYYSYFNRKTQCPDYFMFISCESQDRESLFAATMKIRKIFDSFVIRLEPEKVNVINRMEANGSLRHAYETLFSNLQIKFNLQIYFEYFSMKNELRVYCRKELFEQAQIELNKALANIKEFTTKIDYRGKNVYKVQEIIDSLKGEVQATISFSERCVHVSGPEQKITEFKNKVEGLSNGQKNDCQICFNTLSMPVKLLNCGHAFCTNCLINYLRNVQEDSSKYPLMCPEDDCREMLSIHDLRSLLDYDEFHLTCDRGVQKLVDNVKYHGCYTSNCQNIFEVSKTVDNGNIFECELCSLSYCRSCQKSSHKGISCAKFDYIQKSEISIDEMASLKIRQCERCGQGIERNEGCSYVNCSCGAKICWKCNRAFKNMQDCEEHIPEICNGKLG